MMYFLIPFDLYVELVKLAPALSLPKGYWLLLQRRNLVGLAARPLLVVRGNLKLLCVVS